MADPTPALSLDVTKDLESLSDLKQWLSSRQGAIFNIASDIAKFQGQPIASAVNTSAALSLSGSATWTTKNGIGFSLQPAAKCTIAISDTSTIFQVAAQIDSQQTSPVSAGPQSGVVYVNLEIDFSIQGSVSGSGTVSGVGISGKASGSATATVAFCQPVDATLETLAALKAAFSDIVLPLQPDCLPRLAAGSLTKVNFDATLDCQVAATYGLGSYKVSAPDFALVQQSLAKVWEKLTAPTVDIEAGAKASVSYTHGDHFGLLISRKDANTAMVYLVRSASNESDEQVGVTVGVKASNVSLSLDPSQITAVAQKITGNSTLAGEIGNAVAQPVNKLESSLTTKLNTWIGDINGQTDLTVALSQQSSRTSLFTFLVDLQTANLAQQSWNALLSGSVAQALAIGGFTLQEGSGVSSLLKRSVGIQFHFFNLFQFSGSNDYFSKAYSELGPDGTIRIYNDMGKEGTTQVKQVMQGLRFHFVATATEDTKANPQNAEIDLYMELSEAGDAEKANVLAGVVTMIPSSPLLQSAEDAMNAYIQASPKGGLTIVHILKASAYQKITCSPYSGSTPPPLPQKRDSDNWTAFQTATEALMPSMSFVAPWTYSDWMNFNSICNTNSTGAVPDRRHEGNTQAVPTTFFGNYQNVEDQVIYFFQASAGFMNLCDDLSELATTSSQAPTPQEWTDLLLIVTSAVKDFNVDYGKPMIAGLLHLVAGAGARVTDAIASVAKDSSSLTCTVTLA